MSTQGRKYDAGKPEFSLLPPYALEAVAKVLTVGAQKYAPDNWKHVPNGAYRYKNAAMRHINDYIKGKTLDDETGLNHLAHAICCLMFMLDADESGNALPAGVDMKTIIGPITAGPATGYTIMPQGLPIPGYTNGTDLNNINLSGIAHPVKQKE